jgi:hypothetical protein
MLRVGMKDVGDGHEVVEGDLGLKELDEGHDA